jgi:CRP/FNR family transcriptional regulator, anaerobic regulatory protein
MDIEKKYDYLREPSPKLNSLSNIVLQITDLSEMVTLELHSHFSKIEVPKNYILLKQGKVCNYIWFIEKGGVRYAHLDKEGKEMNVWFSFENDVVCNSPSFTSQTPSLETILTTESCIVHSISYEALKELINKHHEVALWYIALFEKHYIPHIESRVNDLQFLSAKERYKKLLVYFPNIINRISLGHIASYLNITQETLSRIRANKI